MHTIKTSTQEKRRFRIRGLVPAIGRKIDDVIEASNSINARNLMEEKLKRMYDVSNLSVAYCLVEEIDDTIY